MLIILAAIAALAVIVVPLYFINRRAKAGKSVKKPLYANLAMFFVMFAACGCVLLGQGVAAANDAAVAAAPESYRNDPSKDFDYKENVFFQEDVGEALTIYNDYYQMLKVGE